jgi:hypothetical protein
MISPIGSIPICEVSCEPGTTSPVPVMLTIGNDSDATTATALFFH